MTGGDRLSIFAAASDAGERIGLAIGERAYTFAELAAITRERMSGLARETRAGIPHPVVATGTLETVATLYGLLEMGIAALLVHPQLTASERADLAAAATRAGRLEQPGVAAILYTSGTTGEPRGAVLTRSALVASIDASAANLGWEPDDCWALCMPIARIGGLSILLRCLAARRGVALVSAFDAQRFPKWIAERRVTLASLVPTMLTRLLDAHPHWRAPNHLRAVLLGGAAASPQLLEIARARRFPVVVTYGLTEACSHVAATPYEGRFTASDYGAGLPLRGIDLRIRDGRIEIQGPVLMAGYWNEPPLPPGAWFDTGDLGEIDARGCLHVHARRADLIVTGGENAYPAEIERMLETFPGIAAAGVFGLPDEAWGQTVAAALVAKDRPPSDAELLEFVRRRLAPHKRPRHICYVDRLPVAPTGKLDRRGLADLARGLRPLARRKNAQV